MREKVYRGGIRATLRGFVNFLRARYWAHRIEKLSPDERTEFICRRVDSILLLDNAIVFSFSKNESPYWNFHLLRKREEDSEIYELLVVVNFWGFPGGWWEHPIWISGSERIKELWRALEKKAKERK